LIADIGDRKSAVAVVPCPDYDRDSVSSAMDDALFMLGGWERFASRGQRLLVKPNMLSDRPPEAGVTTHPTVVEAVVQRLIDAGAQVAIGDSPSNAHRGVQRHWEVTGYKKVATKFQVDLVSFEGQTSVRKSVQDREYFVAQPVINNEGVINLPRLKTHNLTILTGAVKNMFGILPGFRKSDLHRKFPKPEAFSRAVVDVFEIKPPVLSIMDGVIAMDGNGPGNGRLRKAGLILASADAVALDAVAGVVMGLAPNQVHTTRLAGKRGLGNADLDRIELRGMAWEEIPIRDFRLPDSNVVNRVPEGLSRLLATLVWIQPRIDANSCTRCGKCVEACPVKCISMTRTSAVIDKDECIQCYCCSEVCPDNAVVMDRSLLARMMIR
jgi:uncharacterized protein (DUF362 family)/NAD-dependent dihydropyrimidine dehydrogenase PreA subunit